MRVERTGSVDKAGRIQERRHENIRADRERRRAEEIECEQEAQRSAETRMGQSMDLTG